MFPKDLPVVPVVSVIGRLYGPEKILLEADTSTVYRVPLARPVSVASFEPSVVFRNLAVDTLPPLA